MAIGTVSQDFVGELFLFGSLGFQLRLVFRGELLVSFRHLGVLRPKIRAEQLGRPVCLAKPIAFGAQSGELGPQFLALRADSFVLDIVSFPGRGERLAAALELSGQGVVLGCQRVTLGVVSCVGRGERLAAALELSGQGVTLAG